MINELLSLTELSERSGVETRTLRSWIAQGVVPGPETVGRNARYSSAALTRARAAKAMRDIYNMSLPAIRQDLLTADDARIESYAAMARPETKSAPGAPTAPAIRPPGGTSAADYLHSLRRVGVFGSDASASASPKPSVNVRPEPPPAVSDQQQDSRLARLAEALLHWRSADALLVLQMLIGVAAPIVAFEIIARLKIARLLGLGPPVHAGRRRSLTPPEPAAA